MRGGTQVKKIALTVLTAVAYARACGYQTNPYVERIMQASLESRDETKYVIVTQENGEAYCHSVQERSGKLIHESLGDDQITIRVQYDDSGNIKSITAQTADRTLQREDAVKEMNRIKGMLHTT